MFQQDKDDTLLERTKTGEAKCIEESKRVYVNFYFSTNLKLLINQRENGKSSSKH